MFQNKRILFSLSLLLFVMILRVSPSYMLKWDLMPDYSITYFEEPISTEIKKIQPSEDGELLVLSFSESVSIPYNNERVSLTGFENPDYNTITYINRYDDEGILYITDIAYNNQYAYDSGNFYWEGAGGFFSFLVLLLGYLIPFLIALAWVVSISRKTDKKQKYLSYIALWITGTYVFNMVVFHNSKYLSFSFAAMGLLVFLGAKYIPYLIKAITPNYKQKFKAEKLARKFAETEQQKLEQMIQGWSEKELKDLEWALLNLQFVPDVLHNAENPEDFKIILSEHIKKAHHDLSSIKSSAKSISKKSPESVE